MLILNSGPGFIADPGAALADPRLTGARLRRVEEVFRL